MDESILALNQFKNILENEDEVGNDGFSFEGIVEYHAMGSVTREILNVILIIGGYNPMIKLDIYEKGTKITKDLFHLDFNSRYEHTEFSYNAVKQNITVHGKNSSKLGNYTVIISELK